MLVSADVLQVLGKLSREVSAVTNDAVLAAVLAFPECGGHFLRGLRKYIGGIECLGHSIDDPGTRASVKCDCFEPGARWNAKCPQFRQDTRLGGTDLDRADLLAAVGLGLQAKENPRSIVGV